MSLSIEKVRPVEEPEHRTALLTLYYDHRTQRTVQYRYYR